jgi:hypothetical protein
MMPVIQSTLDFYSLSFVITLTCFITIFTQTIYNLLDVIGLITEVSGINSMQNNMRSSLTFNRHVFIKDLR